MVARGILSFRGTGPLIGQLKKNANLDDVKNIVRMNGAEMHEGMSRRAPVGKTGHLKRSINLYPSDQGFTIKVASEAEYAPYQEYGTRFQSGTAHVRPAFFYQQIKFINDMKRIMK